MGAANANGWLRCTLHGRVVIPLPPPPDYQAIESGRVYLDPEKIILRRTDGLEKAQQEVTGTIMLVMSEGEKIRVVVDIGVLMVVLMERTRYQELRPAVGETMHLQFAANAFTLRGAGEGDV